MSQGPTSYSGGLEMIIGRPRFHLPSALENEKLSVIAGKEKGQAALLPCWFCRDYKTRLMH